MDGKAGDFIEKSKGQVWVETVIYTLIALTVIGLFLSFAKPKIEEIQDKAIIDQSIDMLEKIDGIMLNIVQGGAGNKRVIDIGIKKGTLRIDGVNDQIVFQLEGKYVFTEPGDDGQPGQQVQIGKIMASTQKKGKASIVTLISNYSGTYNITYQEKEGVKEISKAPITYKVSIENKGDVSGIPAINFEVQ